MITVPLGELVDLQSGYRPPSTQTQVGGQGHAIHVSAMDSDRDHIDKFDVPGPGRLWTYELEPLEEGAGKPEQRLTEDTVIMLSRGRRLGAVPVCPGYVQPWPPVSNAIVLYYFYILKPDLQRIEPRFLAWLLNDGPLKSEVERVAQGGTLPYLKSQNLLELEVPLPSLETQQQIVAIYELGLQEQRLNERKNILIAQRTDAICQTILAGSLQGKRNHG